MSTKKQIYRSGIIFFLANVIAGVLNYLYQISAGRNLSVQSFSDLNSWIANYSVFLAMPGVLQYYSCFHPSSKSTLRLIVTITCALSVPLLALWFSIDELLSSSNAVMIIGLSFVLAWNLGQLQIRMAYSHLAVATFLMAVARYGLLWLPLGTPDSLDRYAFAQIGPLVVGLWTTSAFLFRNETKPVPIAEQGWMGPIVLSLTTAVIPQFDLVLMSHSISALNYQEFVQASLFYKAIYFTVFIGAQWILPQQILGLSKRTFSVAKILIPGALVLSGVLAAASPHLVNFVFHWPTPPDAVLVFVSCLHTSLLAVLLLKIQELSSDGRNGDAVLALGSLVLTSSVQMALKLDAIPYETMAVVIQLVFMGMIMIKERRPVGA
ncbi:MAG: hypothetical protein AB7F86_15005 [Bdellovibrionales bacterium]